MKYGCAFFNRQGENKIINKIIDNNKQLKRNNKIKN